MSAQPRRPRDVGIRDRLGQLARRREFIRELQPRLTFRQQAGEQADAPSATGIAA